jgi:hypothetical protein
MAQASSQIMINASADAIWQVISVFGMADQYLAGVVDCTVAGDGVGARRNLTAIDGSTIVEQLETLDASAQRRSYALLTDTPFGNCLTSMTISDLGPNQAELVWSSTFNATGIPEDEAVALLEGALAANCLALRQFMEASR